MGSGLRETKDYLRGLTLLECLITLAIVAILVSIGVPAYCDQLASARARAGAQQLYAQCSMRAAWPRHTGLW